MGGSLEVGRKGRGEAELEAELGGMTAGDGYEGRCPDADAIVWAMTVLSETRSGLPRVRRL